MKELILHIGTHKTGTTSIQHFLTRNQAALAARGVAYFEPASFGDFSLHHNLSLGLLQRALRRADIDYDVTWFAEDKYFNSIETYFENLRHHMESRSLDKAIVSSEGFFGTAKIFCNGLFHDFPYVLSDDEAQRIDWEIIKELRACIGADFNVVVIVYLRRQDLHFDSLYNHYLRDLAFLRHKSPEEYLASAPHEYDYSRELALWADAFGGDSVRPFIFEDVHMSGGLVRHFVNHALEANSSALDYKEYVLNERKPWVVLKFIDAIASSWPEARFGKEHLQDFVNNIPAEFLADVRNSACLDPGPEKRFMDSLSRSNDELGVEFFDRKASPFKPYEQRSTDATFSFNDWIDVARQLAVYYEVKLKELAHVSKEKIKVAQLRASRARRDLELAANLYSMPSYVRHLILAFRILRRFFRRWIRRSRDGATDVDI